MSTPPSGDRAPGALDAQPGLSLTEQVYEALRSEILDAQVRPGVPIVEPMLARRFGVSKTPVREALRLLAHDGLVDVLPRKGYVVHPVSFDDIAEVYTLRLLLEPRVVADAARRRLPHHIATLREILARYESAEDWREEGRLSLELHEAFSAIVGERRTTRILADLLFEAHRFWLLPPASPRELAENAVVRYRAIIDAIEAGDPEQASAAMAELLEQSRSYLVSGIAGPRERI